MIDRCRRLVIVIGSLTGLFLIAFWHSSTVYTQSEPKVRLMPYGTRATIAERLLPDDDIVVIHREFDTVEFSREPTPAQAVAYAAQRADFVAVVHVENVDAQLIEHDTWILTRMVGTVREVIGSKYTSRVTRGDQIEVYVNGGELRIRHVLVKADSLRLPSDQLYLLFLAEDGSVPGLGITYRPLLLRDGTLQSTSPLDEPYSTREPLEGITLDSVAQQVRQLLGR